LEYNDQRDQSNIHETTYHAADHFHLEQFGKFPQGPNDYYPDKNVDGHRAFDQFINVIEERGDEDYVDDIRNLELDKI
tara:strand:- start:649 stop:882 length:234 start_codon:yes stop_codon:yes gene_type:complete